MFGLLFTHPIVFFLSTAGLLLSLTIHEFCHAWMADHLGDPTPRMQGRVTLNPLAHLDPMGTLALLLIRFGWGKPVIYDPYNLKNPVRDGALIALAGPASNLVIATVLGFILKMSFIPWEWVALVIMQIAITNIVLAIFNLVPVYPLDGSKILLAVLPRELAVEYDAVMRQYGFVILIALILPLWQGNSALSFLISPVIDFATHLLF